MESLAFNARPTANEVLVAHLPVGAVLTVHHPDGTTRQYEATMPGEPLIVVVKGDREATWWGASIMHFTSPHQVRNGHHRLDRPVWQKAERMVHHGGIAYVRYEQEDHFGRARWTARDVRQDDLEIARSETGQK